jgi:hypothetical protein
MNVRSTRAVLISTAGIDSETSRLRDLRFAVRRSDVSQRKLAGVTAAHVSASSVPPSVSDCPTGTSQRAPPAGHALASSPCDRA